MSAARPSSPAWRRLAGEPQPQSRVVGQVQRDAAVAFAERLDADPDDFAGRHQRVEHGRLIVLRRAPAGSRARAPTPESPRPAAARSRRAALRGRAGPSRCRATTQEAAERVGVDRLDLLPQPRQRAAAQAAQDVGVDPLALGAARPELAFDQPSRLGQPQQQRLRRRRRRGRSARRARAR